MRISRNTAPPDIAIERATIIQNQYTALGFGALTVLLFGESVMRKSLSMAERSILLVSLVRKYFFSFGFIQVLPPDGSASFSKSSFVIQPAYSVWKPESFLR